MQSPRNTRLRPKLEGLAYLDWFAWRLVRASDEGLHPGRARRPVSGPAWARLTAGALSQCPSPRKVSVSGGGLRHKAKTPRIGHRPPPNRRVRNPISWAAVRFFYPEGYLSRLRFVPNRQPREKRFTLSVSAWWPPSRPRSRRKMATDWAGSPAGWLHLPLARARRRAAP